jgi:hypothetical protein
MRSTAASPRGMRPSLVACCVLCAVMVVIMLLQMKVLAELSPPSKQQFQTSVPDSNTDSLVRGPHKDLLPQSLREHKGPFCVQALINKDFWFQLDTLKGLYYNPLVHRYDPGPCDCDKLCSDSRSFDQHRCYGKSSFCCNGSTRAGHALLSAGERCTPKRYCCPVGLACVDATGQYSMTAGTCGRPSCPSRCSFFDNDCCHDARCDTGNGEVESGNGNCVIVPQWQWRRLFYLRHWYLHRSQLEGASVDCRCCAFDSQRQLCSRIIADVENQGVINSSWNSERMPR